MAGMIDIKRRIKSVQSTRKITRAMQLVSGAKMRRAQNAALSSRTYSDLAWELIKNLSKTQELSPALLKVHPKAQKMAVLLISSNKGFVGSLNTNLLPKLKSLISETGLETEVIVYGQKGKEATVRNALSVTADFEKYERTIQPEDVYPISKLISDLYKTGKYKSVVIIYSHFVSTLQQIPTVKQLLPFEQDIITKAHKRKTEDDNEDGGIVGYGYNYLFEPNPKLVFNHLLPRIIESQIYQTMLEANASEHSARMIMMKNATDAASDIISDLTLTYNQLRQSKITTELTEITAGKIALE